MDVLKKVLVTGYVPIQGHPRTAKEYGELGESMFKGLAGDFVIHPFYEGVESTWLAKHLQRYTASGLSPSHSVADNPAKNTIAYHCVQHQKFAWLLKAAILHPEADTLVWMDYGIGHIRGVTPDVVNAFMEKVRPEIAIPGCWERQGLLISDFMPCWRFCGSMMVFPTAKIHKCYKIIKREVAAHIAKTSNVTWEVNSLAHAEPNLPKITWYKADHDQTMFTNYPEKTDERSVAISDPAVRPGV